MRMSAEEKHARKLARTREAFLNRLISIAAEVTVIKPGPEDPRIHVKLRNCDVAGPLNEVNNILEKCGYRPVRITHNILNPESHYFAIDINTPPYCDPGCESYHSM